MRYDIFVDYLERLEGTTKRLEKTKILAELIQKAGEDITEIIYLVQGIVFPQWDERKLGMSFRLIIKAIASSTGISPDKVEKSFTKKGDLGLVAEEFIKNKKQKTLFSKDLNVKKVFDNLKKLSSLEGHGTVSKKIALVSELLTSANPIEAKYICRTVVDQLRIGVAEGTLRDGIVWAYFPRIIGINDFGKHKNVLEVKKLEDLKNLKKYDFIKAENDKLAREVYNHFVDVVQKTYNIVNDFAVVAEEVKKNGLNAANKDIKLNPGRPLNPMLAIKAKDFDGAFKDVGMPALAEYKIDGFRAQFHFDGKDVKIFTRRLENVSNQFKELIPIVKEHVKAKSFIIDSEIVGYDIKKDKFLSFQSISQRIKRKYDIEKTSKTVPVMIVVFDILYKNGESLIDKTQEERRSILEKTIDEKKHKIELTKKKITNTTKEMEIFYKESLKKGNEGIMIKNLKKIYTPGRRVAGWVKIKPGLEPLDLVIVGGTYGEGKRANALSSFRLACYDEGKFLECGMVGTGIKEKDNEVTFESLTKLLTPLITKKKGKTIDIKPEIVVEVEYEEIQRSPTYNSGYALRFPRVKQLRNMEKAAKDASSLDYVKKIFMKQRQQR
ncbi:MAG: ATP-dependent DNA ligase [Nanoarchaeota archaeon]|nr:ATP-dependent DNA ligase [Nanoarchaeota archaeon]MBU1445483.1 ATP-dependent DNA ligase [Nanoarchaeota archaeon]MBU2420438.1 ATP-dependent DNA ligase [Nanoarchaeota archaeon]MBU2475654.1 ATP-dependent DNA ligase [Nanoarchaeota archaeon]